MRIKAYGIRDSAGNRCLCGMHDRLHRHRGLGNLSLD